MTTEATPPEAWSEDQFDVALRQARAERVIDARNVTLSGDRLERLLRATTEGEPTGPEVRTALFAGTRFLGHAHFANTVFRGEVDFTSAVFTSNVSFHQASFG